MAPRPLALLAFLSVPISAFPAAAEGSFTVTALNETAIERPSETITVAWEEVGRRLGPVELDHVRVRDASGAEVASQVTRFPPGVRGGGELLFQHDFSAGERSATFTVERTETPVAPYPAKTGCRFVPERFDDFAWENDRIAHRSYGPALEAPEAGKQRMVSSGVDVWCKRVRYPIVDRWYLKGAYHEDEGEGLDMYDTGASRGCGGVGIWNGTTLAVSRNYRRWRILANGPIRSVFELDFDPWDIGGGASVRETRRYTVDAGCNLDWIESLFVASRPDAELTVAVGLGRHPAAKTRETLDSAGGTLAFWEVYPKNGSIGTAVVLAPGACSGSTSDSVNACLLATVHSGQLLRFAAGAAWDRAGDIPSAEAWDRYAAAWALRWRSPVRVTTAESPIAP